MGVVLLNLLALALAVYAVGLVFTSNFNMGNLLVWLLAAAVAGYAVFRKPLNVWFSHGAGRVVLVLLCAGFAVQAGIIGFLAVSGYADRPTGQEQVMIVLGAGLRKDKPSNLLRMRLDAAYTYAAQHPELLIVTSGGQGQWEEDLLASTKELQAILESKDIHPFVDIWGTDVSHDWYWWEKQWVYFLQMTLGDA